MQTILELRIPIRNKEDEIVFDPGSVLTIIADKHGQATVSAEGQIVLVGLNDLGDAAKELWLFLRR